MWPKHAGKTGNATKGGTTNPVNSPSNYYGGPSRRQGPARI